jgi:uncharacterized protein
MLNYEIDPTLLLPRLPHGTELDTWNGKSFVSMVGFLFLDVKVLGLPIPWHRNFEEVNLRFYVRHNTPEGWRRGVVFVKEIVPRPAITWVANKWYQEPYVTMPMAHRIETGDNGSLHVSYGWSHSRAPGVRRQGKLQNGLWVEASGGFRDMREGEVAEFITEHYWGYTRHRNGDTWEYQVDHPRWRVADVHRSGFECDVATIYGPEFTEVFKSEPGSALLAEGSPVTVFQGTRIHTN